MRAVFNGVTIAESDATVVVEGVHYFPPESVATKYLSRSGNLYLSPWMGQALYYNVSVDGQIAEDGAWMFPSPSESAQNIAGHFAFWKDITITE